MPVSENEHNEIVGFVPVPVFSSDVHPTPLIENSNIDQETLARPSSIGQEIITLTQNQSLHQRDEYPKYFNAVENFHDMVWTLFTTLLSQAYHYRHIIYGLYLYIL